MDNNSAIPFVNNLPDSLLVEILTCWIEIYHLARLDHAFCNAVARAKFLAIAFNTTAVYRCKALIDAPRHDSIRWLVSRGACMETISTSGAIWRNKRHIKSLLARTGRSVLSVICSKSDKRAERKKLYNVLRNLSMHCPNVTSITCQDMPTVQHFELICNTWPHLTELHLGRGVCQEGFKFLAVRCSNLRVVSCIEACTYEAWKVLLQNNCNTLERIKAELYLNRESDKLLFDNDHPFATLKAVELIIKTQTLQVFADLVANAPVLEEVVLDTCLIDFDVAPIFSAMVSRLKVFKVHGLNALSDAGMATLAQNSPNLLVVQIALCCGITDVTVVALGQHCHILTELVLHNVSELHITDESVHALAAGCPLLQRFDVTDSTITDAGMLALMAGCPQLSVISLDASDVGDTALLAMPQLLPNLKSLVLIFCMHTAEAVRAVIRGCRKLTYVKVQYKHQDDLKAVRKEMKLQRKGFTLTFCN